MEKTQPLWRTRLSGSMPRYSTATVKTANDEDANAAMQHFRISRIVKF